MSITAIAGGLLSQLIPSPGQNQFQQIKQGFQKLAKDLQSGNVSQAQSDFAAFQQYLPGAEQVAPSSPTASATTSAGPQSGSPLTSAVAQLSTDLQSHNLNAAQADFATVQQDVQQIGQQRGSGHAHHHHGSGGGSSSQDISQQNAISALFGDLGQSLQAGNLAAAQQAYSTLQLDFQRLAAGNSSASSTPSSSPSSSSSLDVSV